MKQLGKTLYDAQHKALDGTGDLASDYARIAQEQAIVPAEQARLHGASHRSIENSTARNATKAANDDAYTKVA